MEVAKIVYTASLVFAHGAGVVLPGIKVLSLSTTFLV
jgi:hypothetical protein